MEYTIDIFDQSASARLQGNFNFSDNPKFREIIARVTGGNVRSVTLDFSGIDFVDSAALGMLLLLREECSKRQIGVVLKSPGGQVKKMFDLSKFDHLFTVIHG